MTIYPQIAKSLEPFFLREGVVNYESPSGRLNENNPTIRTTAANETDMCA